MSRKSTVFPFSAIVGQDLLKKSLLLNVIDPNIGGVLIRGDRGTAKSTAVRALAQLLPERAVVEGCPFGCSSDSEMEDCPVCSSKDNVNKVMRNMRVVELPVSATEDRVVGTIDISSAIKSGEKRFEPGILAEANGNILYIDEVNLLNDHIVDVLLDVAAMGLNTVEREGVSYSHPSRFVLVGTMNPEEGDLRPQLLDRFGLCVSVEGITDVESRMLVAERRRDYTKDPEAFMGQWKAKDAEITRMVVEAKRLLPEVIIASDMMRLAVETCIEYNVEGHRADITIMNAAAAIAALNGRKNVVSKDIEEAAVMVLAHRTKDPPQYVPPNEDKEHDDDRKDPEKKDQDQKDDRQPAEGDDGSQGGNPSSTVDQKANKEFVVKRNVLSDNLLIDDLVRESSGRRNETVSSNGRYTGSKIPNDRPSSIALDATIRAAAASSAGKDFKIDVSDIREKIRTRKSENLIIFTVDASGSMGAEQRMSLVKASILSLLTDAYQKRDRVCLVTFRGDSADVIVPPTNSTELAKRMMGSVKVGGKTPLAAGLATSLDVIRRETFKDHLLRPIMVLVSDGRANCGRGDVKAELAQCCNAIRSEKVDCVVLDSELGFIKLGMAKKLSDALGARYMELDMIRA